MATASAAASSVFFGRAVGGDTETGEWPCCARTRSATVPVTADFDVMSIGEDIHVSKLDTSAAVRRQRSSAALLRFKTRSCLVSSIYCALRQKSLHQTRAEVGNTTHYR